MQKEKVDFFQKFTLESLNSDWPPVANLYIGQTKDDEIRRRGAVHDSAIFQ